MNKRQTRRRKTARTERNPVTGEWQPTACTLCECNCGIVAQLEGRKLACIEPAAAPL